jgi:hypothetical protein
VTNSHTDWLPVCPSLELAVGSDRTRIVVVRENDGGSDKHTVLEHCRLIHECVILKLAVVAHDDARTHVGSPTDDASSAQSSTLADLSEWPHGRAVTQDDVFSNFSTSVNGHEGLLAKALFSVVMDTVLVR